MTPWPAVSHALHRLRAVAGHGWSWLRQVSGDAAYDNYLRSIHRASLSTSEAAVAPPLSPADFYLDTVRRRYSSISLCC